MRLLVVEDDIPIQQFLKRALVGAGYQVDTASTAKAGETMALEGIHDALIIDLGLPDLDGLDLIARCRAHGKNILGFNLVRPPFCRRARQGTGAGRGRLPHEAICTAGTAGKTEKSPTQVHGSTE